MSPYGPCRLQGDLLLSNHKGMKTKQKNYAEKAPKNDNKNCGQWQAQGRYEEVFILTLGSSAVKLPAAGVDASAPHSPCRQEFLEGEYHF